MEWFLEEPARAKAALICLVILITGLILWLRRRTLGVAVALVFLFFAALTSPSMIPARLIAQRNACIANLAAIQAAKAEWAKVNKKEPTETPHPEDLFGTDGFLRDRPACPRGGEYTIGPVNQKPSCSLAHKRHTLER